MVSHNMRQIKTQVSSTYHGYDKVVDEHDGGLAEQEGGQDSAPEDHHVGHHQGLRPERVLAVVLFYLPHLNTCRGG